VTQPPGQAYPAPPPYHRPLPPPALSPGGQPLADFGTRLLAFLIDGAIVTAVALVIFVPAIVAFTVSRLNDFPAAPGTGIDETDLFGDFIGPLLLLQLGLLLLLLAAYYVYYVEMMYRSGQTIGKRAMKIRVVPADPAVPKLSRGMVAKRYVVQFVAGVLIPMFSYLDGLWQLWDKPYQQTLHDKFAQTVVIKVSA
jgi:uncharacterized RDD family membrane protein YckC